jgi:hypothetical protein
MPHVDRAADDHDVDLRRELLVAVAHLDELHLVRSGLERIAHARGDLRRVAFDGGVGNQQTRHTVISSVFDMAAASQRPDRRTSGSRHTTAA